MFPNGAGCDLLSLKLQLFLLFTFLLHSLPPHIPVEEHQAVFKAVGTLWGIRGKASVLKELPFQDVKHVDTWGNFRWLELSAIKKRVR